MSYDFTAADVIAKVREIASASPDFVYHSPKAPVCVNVAKTADGQWVGSCIVGQAVVALGVPAKEIWDKVWDAFSAEALLRHLGVSASGLQDAWLLRVQARQDSQVPWAEAITAADQAFPEIANAAGAGMSYDFTAVDVIAKIRELAAAQPDFVYGQIPCVNVEADDAGNWVGSCIVGRAVIALGIPADDVAERAWKSGAAILLTQFEIPFTLEQQNWIEYVQEYQDNSVPWRLAVAESEINCPTISGLSDAEINALRKQLAES